MYFPSAEISQSREESSQERSCSPDSAEATYEMPIRVLASSARRRPFAPKSMGRIQLGVSRMTRSLPAMSTARSLGSSPVWSPENQISLPFGDQSRWPMANQPAERDWA